MAEEEPRTRLARNIRSRRNELRLSQRLAAQRARIARNTWTSAEDGTRDLAERNYAGVETALNWTAGSVQAVLAGGEPTTTGERARSAPIDLESEIERVRALNVPAHTKLSIIHELIDLHRELDE